MAFIELATGARLHYEDVGSGPPLILVHGFMGTARTEFERIIAWLRPDYRVLGPTLRGYGQSTPKPREFPPDFYYRDADDVLAFMDALDIASAHILGYSDGGEVALIAGGKQPGRFKSAVVWGAVGYYGPAMLPAVQRMYPPTWMTVEDQTLHGIANPEQFVLRWIQTVKQIIDSGGDLSLSLAAQISPPLLMLLGEQDRLNPKEYGERFIQKTPNGRLEMFACGHAVHDEDWPRFQENVGAFLARH